MIVPRWIAGLAASLLAASALAAGSVPPAEPSSSVLPRRGDVTVDGSIAAVDALAVLASVVGKPLPQGYAVSPHGDVTCDGEVAALDALVVLSHVVGKDVSAFCLGEILATLAPLSGDGQNGLRGVPLADSLVVRAQGVDGTPLTGLLVRWSVSGGTLSDTATLTDSAGRAMTLLTPDSGAVSIQAVMDSVAPAHLQASGATSAAQWLGRNGYVEYRAGTLPLVISAPHGGTLEPAEIPDRTQGTTVRDFATDDVARKLADSLEVLTGERPHLVVSNLHRIKLDPNRELSEASEGHPLAQQAWREYHGLMAIATAQVGTGFLADIHGHGHPIDRLELGYGVTGSELEQPDSLLDLEGPGSSVAALLTASGVSLSTLVRGPASLGARFVEEGYPAVPSATIPDPGGASFFSGGYITRTWGSGSGGGVSAVQIEAHKPGVRDSEEARGAFAGAAARVLRQFLVDWYGFGGG